MIIRKTDSNDDWTFGKGKSNYLKDLDAVSQNIKSRVLSWAGDCYFAAQEGIDWFNFLDKGQKDNLNLAVKSVILASYGVVGLTEISVDLDSERKITITYSVDTIFGQSLQNIIEQEL